MNILLRTIASLLLGLASLAMAHGAKLGELDIGHPFARSTAPGQPSAGAYLSITNHGANDRLVGASTPVAKAVQLHTMRMEGDVMRMRELDAIELPAGQSVTLAPGGLHLMLIGLTGPLKAGESFPMTLKFEKAGEVTVKVVVQQVEAGGAHTH